MRLGRHLGFMVFVAGIFAGADARSASERSYAAGGVGLELDGARSAVKEASGGAAYGDVVSEALGPDHVTRKHIAAVKYEPISLKVGADMSKALMTWTSDTLNLKFAPKNGAILGLDSALKEQSRRMFYNGFLSDIVFPELDASSKDPAYISLKISPEYTRVAPASGAAVATPPTPAQKATMASAFRLTIDGLDTTTVSRIEAMDVKLKIGVDQVGVMRNPTRAPANLEIPDLVFYVSESHADSIAKWHEDFVVKGNNGEDKEKNGRIEMLSPSGQVVYSLELQHLGITHFTPEAAAGADAMRRIRVEMYFEQIKLTPGTMAQ